MKPMVLVLLLCTVSSCYVPLNDQAQPVESGDPAVAYSPPSIQGAKDIRVIRPPRGTVSRAVVARDDPLFLACNEPGTVYMFYDDGAIVQYIPVDGTYSMFSAAVRGDVEVHNSLNPSEKWWDFVSVSAPGPVIDWSHDPECPALTFMILNNSGDVAWEYSVDVLEYNFNTYADGSPNSSLKLSFEAMGGYAADNILHMRLGGNGDDRPPRTFP